MEVTGLDQLDPAVHPARDAVNFRRILAARQGIAAAEQGTAGRGEGCAGRRRLVDGDRVCAGHDPSGGAAALRRQLTGSWWGPHRQPRAQQGAMESWVVLRQLRSSSEELRSASSLPRSARAPA